MAGDLTFGFVPSDRIAAIMRIIVRMSMRKRTIQSCDRRLTHSVAWENLTENVTCACGQITFATHAPPRRRRQVDVVLGPALAPTPQTETCHP
jgi:hypothetical protein